MDDNIIVHISGKINKSNQKMLLIYRYCVFDVID